MIHVLIPTRGRPGRVLQTIESLERTANNLSDVSIILRTDTDDEETNQAVIGSWNAPAVSCVCGPRPPEGYAKIHTLYTELSDRIPPHDPIWIMNDDCTVEGHGWDSDVMAHFPYEGYIAQPQFVINGQSSYENVPDGPFPIVPNKCWEKFGHKGFGNNLDVWLHDLLVKENRWLVHYMKGITVNHQRKIDATLTKERF